jgi:hypothetical protein
LGWIKDPADLFTSAERSGRSSWAPISVGNLMASIEAARHRPLARVITALGIPLVGGTVARSLARRFRSMQALLDATPEEIGSIDGIGPEIVQSVRTWTTDKANRKLVARLAAGGVELSEAGPAGVDTGLLSGLTLVITGTLEGFSREGARTAVEERGGKVTSSVSAKTTAVVAGEAPGRQVKGQCLGIHRRPLSGCHSGTGHWNDSRPPSARLCLCPIDPGRGFRDDAGDRHVTLVDRGWRVLWTRGDVCRELAPALGEAGPVEGDLRAACLRQRADLLVARKLTSFGLISVAVPHGYHRKDVTGIVAAVGGGPHSILAAVVAERLGTSLDVPAAIASGSRSSREDATAESLLAEVGTVVPELPAKVVRADSARALVAGLPAGSFSSSCPESWISVSSSAGAPGGQAPAGAIVV